ncbi:MAG: hypothetical protein JW981_04720, partial [Anaerolineae bacterium]|nr:hypothetical protein [Anaerolineae bacterium]
MRYWLVFLLCIPLVVLPLGFVGAQAEIPDGAVARVVYFYPKECESCEILYQEVIESLMAQCGTALEIKKVEIGTSAGYEAFLATEKALTGKSGVWDIPVAVLGSKVFIGEETIREGLESAIKCAWLDGGNEWPPVPELEAVAAPDFVGDGGSTPFGSEGD